jgi:serine phosphatase RsbU (regulator of sigma subunit)
MAVEPGQREQTGSPAVPPRALEALAAAAVDAGGGDALAPLVHAAGVEASADAVIVRTVDHEWLVARSVWSTSASLRAELEGSRFPLAELPVAEIADAGSLPGQPGRAVERLGVAGVLLIPLTAGGRPLGTLELLRRLTPFDEEERAFARLAAAHVALVLALGAGDAVGAGTAGADEALRLVGEALAAGADERAVSEQVTRLAAEASGAFACLLWRTSQDERGGEPVLVWAHGLEEALDSVAGAERVAQALAGRRVVTVEEGAGLPGDALASAILPLGQPPLGALELLFDREPGADLTRLAMFGARAAHALRTSERAQRLEAELERSRTLLAVVGQAIAELSLAHTLETAVERVAELLAADRVAVYLRENGAVLPAAGRGLAGPHGRVAERLLELVLGPFRGRGLLVIDDARADPGLRRVRESIQEAGIEAAIAVPLGIQDDVIGLLAVYPERGRGLTGNEAALLRALAVQLAVAVQNARLHEEVKQREEDLKASSDAERQAARQVRALYEISRSFAQSLDLDETLDALATSVVDLLEVDAAAIHVPGARGDVLEFSAIEARDNVLGQPLRTLLERTLLSSLWPPRTERRPVELDAASAREAGEVGAALVNLLERGARALVVPVSAPADPGGKQELLATLTVLSVDPGRPLDAETVELAATIAGQAALAIDNARLYQQQKDFADTMQRSLLPSEAPRLEGLELGAVYDSSARLDVGGDVYDYVVLGDGRLAVALGDVTGHGVEATADMAMTKWVFRSVSREHPEPGDFLAHANEVVVDEVAAGKFVTMAYLTIDPVTGAVACGLAGHPPPRVVSPDGSVRQLAARGLPLGIADAQEYTEVADTLEPGAAVVLYTDGVVEARRDRELYGEERLDAQLSAGAGLEPKQLAEAVLADCSAFGGGELTDDCAVVVIRRT